MAVNCKLTCIQCDAVYLFYFLRHYQYHDYIAPNDRIDELESIWKETAVAHSTPGIFLEGLTNYDKPLVKMAGVPVKIVTENFPNTSA
jgi:hypothetical protein